jgi:hypothetical protein
MLRDASVTKDRESSDGGGSDLTSGGCRSVRGKEKEDGGRITKDSSFELSTENMRSRKRNRKSLSLLRREVGDRSTIRTCNSVDSPRNRLIGGVKAIRNTACRESGKRDINLHRNKLDGFKNRANIPEIVAIVEDISTGIKSEGCVTSNIGTDTKRKRDARTGLRKGHRGEEKNRGAGGKRRNPRVTGGPDCSFKHSATNK